VRPCPPLPHCCTVADNNNTQSGKAHAATFPAVCVPLSCSLLPNCSVLSSNTHCGRCT
jgi:hypothetical protein